MSHFQDKNVKQFKELKMTPSWRGVQLEHRDKFTSFFFFFTYRF